MFVDIVNFLNWAILWYLIFLSLGYLILLVTAVPDILSNYEEDRLGELAQHARSRNQIPVTVIISAYNEEDTILESIYSVIKSDYGNLQIIVVNDGSTDHTLKVLNNVFDLQRLDVVIPNKVKTRGKLKGYYISNYNINLTVIDKENSGKSDSLNVALNICRTPLFITLDADSILDPESITNIVFHMLIHPHTVAVGGAVYILNGCDYKDGVILKKRMSRKPLYALQSCEYMRSFLFSRSGWNKFGGALSFSGAFTLFDHRAVVDVGGFDRVNLAQDFEIITHLHEYEIEQNREYTIAYTASAIAWTDVPGTLKSFWRQRVNWQKDTLRSLLLHKKMLFNPRYGLIGMVSYPFYLFGETLGVCVEFSAYVLIFFSWYLGILDGYWVFLFFAICWGFVTFLTMATAFISLITFNQYRKITDMLWIFLIVATESFGFRQFTVLCRIVATFQYFVGRLKFWK